MEQWLSKAQAEAKVLVMEVENKVKEVEKRMASCVAGGKVISQKVEQQNLKVDRVLELSKENAARTASKTSRASGYRMRSFHNYGLHGPIFPLFLAWRV